MAKSRITGPSEGVSIVMPEANPVPNAPEQFYWDDYGKKLVWKKDTNDDMSAGTFTIEFASVYAGKETAWELLAENIANSGGDYIEYTDPVSIPGRWYRIKAANNYSNESGWTGPVQHPDANDYCEVYGYYRDSNMTPIGNAVIKFEIENAAHLVLPGHHFIQVKTPEAAQTESLSGYFKIRLLRTSVIGKKYKITYPTGYVHTGVTIPDELRVAFDELLPAIDQDGL